jgi:hypothetical protein
MEEPLAELAGYSRGGSQVPDTDLVRLTAAARTAGHRWDAIAAACDNGPGQDIPGVIRQQYWISPAVGPGPLFSATQRAARNLAGHKAGCYRPLTWPCPGCGHQVTDLAPGGRPVHAELGHAAGCTRLARDQGADDALRREWLPRLILYSDDPIGSLKRTGWPGRSPMTARAAAGMATSATTWPPSTATGLTRSAMTAMPT